MKQGCIDLCVNIISLTKLFDRGYSSFSITSILKVKCGKNVM